MATPAAGPLLLQPSHYHEAPAGLLKAARFRPAPCGLSREQSTQAPPPNASLTDYVPRDKMRPHRSGPEHAVEREERASDEPLTFKCPRNLRMTERAPAESAHRYPPRSKMLDTYLSDVGRRLAAEQVTQAKELAVNLPHIAVALSDANLQSSCEAYREWCARWVTPARKTSEYDDWCTEASPTAADFVQGVPFKAIQALRLRRGVREVTSPPVPPLSQLNPEEFPQAEVCDALLHATRTWYAKQGRHDPTVQQNLARLGVLR